MHPRAVGGFEEEKFGFGTDVEGPAAFGDFFEHPLEDVARVALEGSPVGSVDVAEDAGASAFLRSPGEDGVGFRVEDEAHIAFLNPRKSFHRGAVEPDAVFQRFRQTLDGHIYAFHRAGDIGKLERDEFDAVFLDAGE